MPRTIVPQLPNGNIERAVAAVRSAQAKRIWRADAVAGLPRSIHVQVSSSAAVLRLQTLFRFAGDEAGCGIGLFDLASWPYEAYLDYPVDGPTPRIQGSLLRFPLVLASGGQECVCRLEFEWRAGGSSGTLRSLGQLVPEIVLPRAQAMAQSLTLSKLELTVLPDLSNATEVKIALHSADGGSKDTGEMPAWVLMHPPKITHVAQTRAGDPTTILQVENVIGDLVSAGHLSEFIDSIALTASAISRLLGTNIPKPLLVLLRRPEADPETPGVVLFTEDQLRSLDPYSLSYEAGRQIASVSWGVACRAHGRTARELEEAISAAVAVRAADLVTGADRSSAMLVRLRARAIRTAPLQPWQRVLGIKQHRVVFQLGANLLELALERGDELFSYLTARAWKRSLRTDYVLQLAEQFTGS